MKNIKIKIGHQTQANKPIFLLHNGHIVCGKFIYKGRFIKTFANYYRTILEHTDKKNKQTLLDVSAVRYWDAITIYDHYLIPRWQRGITTKKIENFARESKIYKIIEEMKPEFKHALRQKWKKIFMKWDKNDPNLPRNPWEII
jgi:hypothetical protein